MDWSYFTELLEARKPTATGQHNDTLRHITTKTHNKTQSLKSSTHYSPTFDCCSLLTYVFPVVVVTKIPAPLKLLLKSSITYARRTFCSSY